jgi:hypothetical protein
MYEQEAVEELIQHGVRIDRRRGKNRSMKSASTLKSFKAQHKAEEADEKAIDKMLGCPKCKFSKVLIYMEHLCPHFKFH